MEDLKDVIFLEDDTPATIAIKTVEIHAGSSTLKTELRKLNIEYSKVVKGLNTYYYLKGDKIGQIRVKL